MDKVWAKWDMSTVECSENNGGKIGDAKVKALQSEWTNGGSSALLLPMPVLKGNWPKDAASDGGI
jgi:hypothetical protein